MQQAAEHKTLDQLIAVVVGGVVGVWRAVELLLYAQRAGQVVAPLLKRRPCAEAVFPDAQKHLGVGQQLARKANAADAVEQGNGEVAQVGLRADVAELLANRLPEMAAQLVVAVEGFHRVIAIGMGWIQLAEGMQQQFVDVGLLLGQHGEHLEPHGGLVVVGAQQLLELAVAHR